jgi:hypothetical protein
MGTSALCPLCKSHLVLYCPTSAAVRQHGMSRLQEAVGPSIWSIIRVNPDVLLQTIIDCRHPFVQQYICADKTRRVENISRQMCYGIHRLRSLCAQ